MRDEYQRKDKQAHRNEISGILGALTVRSKYEIKNYYALRKIGTSSDKKILGKEECLFSHQKGNWKKDCPKLQAKDNEHKANVVSMSNEDEDFVL